MTNTDQPQDFANIGRIANYLQQLILLDMLAKVFEAQKRGGDYLPLLKSLSDYALAQASSEQPNWELFAAILSFLEPSGTGSDLP